MSPSTYQQAIYDAIPAATDNIFVDAVAGSGKTTTLKGICERLADEQRADSIFLAFNKKIVDALVPLLPTGMWVRTMHSIGMYNLRQAVNPRVKNWVDDDKYQHLIVAFLDSHNYQDEVWYIMHTALTRAVRFSRLTLVDLENETSFEEMLNHFDIESVDGLRLITKTILQKGEDLVREVIDFTDMVYLPIRMNIAMKKFGNILVDEAQDLSACHREMVRRMMRTDSRAIFVGDEKQSIMGFAGAEVNSVERIVNEFACVRMPLSICYRCPSSHIAMAQEIVSHIEAAPNAEVGIIRHLAYDDNLGAQPGDLVMCRTNAPLVSLAFQLIAAGVPAALTGRDIMGQIVTMARSVMKLSGANWNEFQKYLDEYVDRQTKALKRKTGTDAKIEALQDRADCLRIIVMRAQALDHRISTIKGLEGFIDRIYGDERGAVILSSVHRAKGLEANNTFILGLHELMPHSMATSDWAIEQEYNLKYVALTRAKKSMSIVALPPRGDK